jgi:hypothetical protein
MSGSVRHPIRRLAGGRTARISRTAATVSAPPWCAAFPPTRPVPPWAAPSAASPTSPSSASPSSATGCTPLGRGGCSHGNPGTVNAVLRMHGLLYAVEPNHGDLERINPRIRRSASGQMARCTSPTTATCPRQEPARSSGSSCTDPGRDAVSRPAALAAEGQLHLAPSSEDRRRLRQPLRATASSARCHPSPDPHRGLRSNLGRNLERPLTHQIEAHYFAPDGRQRLAKQWSAQR